ncbi:uncharacterized protein LOC127792367 [Diospyros lotus]|uniref:uncharacterized protein LOC127792367 n=1 Tax=Diospyros lotus TaxID=55363 RepID=UPI002253535E|nr:uncharacterized protein LOC127792367 [Diospyros lotus]
MAMAVEGFSIREYASKMRTVDVMKSWPFGRESDETRREDIEASLPLITVEKFRWWSDELELVRSSEDMPEICGESSNQLANETILEPEKMEVALELAKMVLCREGEKLGVTVDGHLAYAPKDEQRRQMKIRVKSRAQKKRSIVEIFAVAPQVERVVDDDDDNKDSSQEDGACNSKVLALGDVGSNVKFKKAKKMKKPKLINETISKFKKQKRLKKGKKNERDCVDRLVQPIPKKGKSHKPKLQSPIDRTTKLSIPLCSKGLGKDIWDAAPIHKKKQRVKYLSGQKNKLAKTSKLVKHKKSAFPVCGILKNHKKGISGEASTVYDSQIGSRVNQCGLLQVDRHVRFSDKDDILVTRKPFSSAGGHKSQNIGSLSLPIERGKDLAISKVSESDEDVLIGTENETQVHTVSERQLSDTCHLGMPNLLSPQIGCQDHLSERSMTVNQVAACNEKLHSFEQGHTDASYGPLYAYTPRFLSTLKEGYNLEMNTQVSGGTLGTSNSSDRLIGFQSGNSKFSDAAICSVDYKKAVPSLSSSCFPINGNANQMLLHPSQSTTVNYNNHSMQYQPLHHISPKELMQSICSFPDWKQRAIMAEEKCINEDFCGLPLNSQGELIQLNSRGKGVFNQVMRPIQKASSECLPLHGNGANSYAVLSNVKDTKHDGGGLTKDQLKLFPVWNSVKENPSLPVSPWVGICGLQGTGKLDIQSLDSVEGNNHSVYHMESGLNLSHHGHRQDNQVDNQFRDAKGHQVENPDRIANHITQPTMKLMGKEFTVGRSSKDLQSFEDGNIWTDKEIIAEHCPPNAAINRSSSEREFGQDLISQPSSSKLKEKVSWLSETQISRASQSMLQMKPPDSTFSQPYLNCGSDAQYQSYYPSIDRNHISKFHSYLPLDPSTPLFTRTFPVKEPFISGYQSLKIDSRISNFASSHGNASLNSAELQNKQKLPHATTSMLEFPFLRQDSRENPQPSWFQNSSKRLPPWLLSATQQKESSHGYYQPDVNLEGIHRSCTISRGGLQTLSSVRPAPEVFYPCNPACSHSGMQNSLGSTSLTRPPLIPLARGYMPASAIDKIHGDRMQSKERMCPTVKELGHSKKIRKRSAAKLDDCAKLTKIPRLTVQEETGSRTQKTGMVALGLDLVRDQPSSVGCGQIRTSELQGPPAIDAFNADAIERSGPIKLTAGAKHILKPVPNSNQDRSKQTHSTIPFAAATSSVRVSESEKKSAKIYKF